MRVRSIGDGSWLGSGGPAIIPNAHLWGFETVGRPRDEVWPILRGQNHHDQVSKRTLVSRFRIALTTTVLASELR